ncbi:hypothetical protein ACQKWADRAFT_219396 [Trichoderma austrokoningii]
MLLLFLFLRCDELLRIGKGLLDQAVTLLGTPLIMLVRSFAVHSRGPLFSLFAKHWMDAVCLRHEPARCFALFVNFESACVGQCLSLRTLLWLPRRRDSLFFRHDSQFASQDRFTSVSDVALAGAYSLRVSVRAGRSKPPCLHRAFTSEFAYTAATATTNGVSRMLLLASFTDQCGPPCPPMLRPSMGEAIPVTRLLPVRRPGRCLNIHACGRRGMR